MSDGCCGKLDQEPGKKSKSCGNWLACMSHMHAVLTPAHAELELRQTNDHLIIEDGVHLFPEKEVKRERSICKALINILTTACIFGDSALHNYLDLQTPLNPCLL